MINRVVLVGRLTRDPEINEGSSLVARFSIAVDRIRGPEPVTDFFTIVSFGKTAEFVRNYVKKGALVGIDGRLQQNNFTRKDGTKSYSVDVIAESVQSLESRGARNASGETVEYTQTVENEKSNEPLDIQEDDLPF